MTGDEEREPPRGTICRCGLAKSYHGQESYSLTDHEYEPRYPARRAHVHVPAYPSSCTGCEHLASRAACR